MSSNKTTEPRTTVAASAPESPSTSLAKTARPTATPACGVRFTPRRSAVRQPSPPNSPPASPPTIFAPTRTPMYTSPTRPTPPKSLMWIEAPARAKNRRYNGCSMPRIVRKSRCEKASGETEAAVAPAMSAARGSEILNQSAIAQPSKTWTKKNRSSSPEVSI